MPGKCDGCEELVLAVEGLPQFRVGLFDDRMFMARSYLREWLEYIRGLKNFSARKYDVIESADLVAVSQQVNVERGIRKPRRRAVAIVFILDFFQLQRELLQGHIGVKTYRHVQIIGTAVT